MTTRFLITGESGVGKSTLACSLYVRLRMDGVDATLYELDPWSDTHDCILGKKPWDKRNKRSGQDVYDDYARGVERFKLDSHDVVIGDMEGSLEWRYNELLVEAAHQGILLWKTTQGGVLHRELLDQLHIPLLAEMSSGVSVPHWQGPGPDFKDLQRNLAPMYPPVGHLASLVWQTTRQNS